MIKNNKKIFIFAIIFLIISVFILKLINENKNIKESNIITEDETPLFGELNNLSSWITYWDLNVDDEIMELDNKLGSLSYFAAYFDDNNQLVLPEKLLKYYNDTNLYKFKKYISIVNDIVYDDGTSSIKDKEVLSKVLSDETARRNHINEIIDLAKKYDFDGIEIDYEQIKEDISLWKDFLLFIKDLYSESTSNNLELRVLLEPNVPIDKLNFIEGPTYVMMCYNLHGAFSGPGEKSNQEFIKELIDKMKKVPGEKSFAIPTGGFDWADNGNTKSISEIEAKQMLGENKIEAKRDDKTQYLYFNYTDKENIKHEVWYADQVTIRHLSEVIIEEGYDVSLWRLGGNLFD